VTDSAKPPVPAFVLTEGGPTYHLERRLRLVRENSPLIVRRAFISIALTWLPLFVCSMLQGLAFGKRVPVPFVGDFSIHARFLLAVPLFFCAEAFLGPHLAQAARHFVSSGLVVEEDFTRFQEAIDKGLKWRDGMIGESILALLAYITTAINLLSWTLHVSTWYAFRSESGYSLTWAGWWYVIFCVPLFQFLALRWFWRLFLWGQFLWRMNKLNLQLTPTHPDEAGGLAFVGEAQRFFGGILLAYSIAVSGVLANQLIYDKIPLSHFAPSIAAYVIVAVGIVLLPMGIFAGTLLKTKRRGLYQYGTLATTYTTRFHKRWIVGEDSSNEPLLGTGDIQSLADLGNSFQFIEKMNALPISPRTPIHLVLACLLPMAPLLLTVMPLKDILRLLLKVVV
jgi:hypothetical protein